jgi:hypothetical protein
MKCDVREEDSKRPRVWSHRDEGVTKECGVCDMNVQLMRWT